MVPSGTSRRTVLIAENANDVVRVFGNCPGRIMPSASRRCLLTAQPSVGSEPQQLALLKSSGRCFPRSGQWVRLSPSRQCMGTLSPPMQSVSPSSATLDGWYGLIALGLLEAA